MTTSKGSCHCGAVRFEAEVAMDQLATCNCSICGRTGSIMAFIPADKLHRIAGDDKLTDYQFGKKNIHHSFCSICGVRPYGLATGPDGKPGAMVNVRCLEGVDVHQVKIAHQYNGRAV